MVIAKLGGFNTGVWENLLHGILARLRLTRHIPMFQYSYSIKKCGEESCVVCRSLWMAFEISATCLA